MLKLWNYETTKKWNDCWIWLKMAGIGWYRHELAGIFWNRIKSAGICLHLPNILLDLSSFVPLYYLVWLCFAQHCHWLCLCSRYFMFLYLQGQMNFDAGGRFPTIKKMGRLTDCRKLFSFYIRTYINLKGSGIYVRPLPPLCFL